MAIYVLADIVREIAGDVDSAVSNQLVNYYLCETGNNVFAAAQMVALAMAARSASVTEAKVGDVSVKSGIDQVTGYLKIAELMRRQVILTTVAPEDIYAGGISQSDKTTNEENTDRVPPYFTRQAALLIGAQTDTLNQIADVVEPAP